MLTSGSSSEGGALYCNATPVARHLRDIAPENDVLGFYQFRYSNRRMPRSAKALSRPNIAATIICKTQIVLRDPCKIGSAIS